MQNRITSSRKHIDCATATSVRNAIGERLRQNMRLESTALPSHLQRLLDEMERQDRGNTAEHAGT